MRPIIGITCPWSEETWGPTVDGGGYDYAGRAYASAIYIAGGFPILLPPISKEEEYEQNALKVLGVVDGLFFSGGGNVRRTKSVAEIPTLFEQQPARSKWEKSLLELAFARNVPTFGVCRGYQMMAVTFGGSMDTVRLPQHRQTVSSDIAIHNVRIAENSLLAKTVGNADWFVNSLHVERVKVVPDGFVAAAWADDGSIEAISAIEKDFFMGTQFHPELMPQDLRSQMIFEKLVSAAKKYRTSR